MDPLLRERRRGFSLLSFIWKKERKKENTDTGRKKERRNASSCLLSHHAFAFVCSLHNTYIDVDNTSDLLFRFSLCDLSPALIIETRLRWKPSDDGGGRSVGRLPTYDWCGGGIDVAQTRWPRDDETKDYESKKDTRPNERGAEWSCAVISRTAAMTALCVITIEEFQSCITTIWKVQLSPLFNQDD